MIRAKVLKSMLLVASVLVHDEEVLLMLTYNETLIELSNYPHILEPLFPEKRVSRSGQGKHHKTITIMALIYRAKSG